MDQQNMVLHTIGYQSALKGVRFWHLLWPGWTPCSVNKPITRDKHRTIPLTCGTRGSHVHGWQSLGQGRAGTVGGKVAVWDAEKVLGVRSAWHCDSGSVWMPPSSCSLRSVTVVRSLLVFSHRRKQKNSSTKHGKHLSPPNRAGTRCVIHKAQVEGAKEEVQGEPGLQVSHRSVPIPWGAGSPVWSQVKS